jgi:predicted outer membrane repeat protein
VRTGGGAGGGIYALGALHVFSSTFIDNGDSTVYNGGAIYVQGPATVEQSTFTGNSVGNTSGSGGAIYAEQAITLTASTFIGNAAAPGSFGNGWGGSNQGLRDQTRRRLSLLTSWDTTLVDGILLPILLAVSLDG